MLEEGSENCKSMSGCRRSSATLCRAPKQLSVLLRKRKFSNYSFHVESGAIILALLSFSCLIFLICFQLFAKINEELPNLEKSEETNQIERHYKNTIAHIKNRMETNDAGAVEISFAGLVIE